MAAILLRLETSPRRRADNMGQRSTTADERIRGYLDSGLAGTVRAISKTTGVNMATVYTCLVRLENAGVAARVAQQEVNGSRGRPMADIWARKTVDDGQPCLSTIAAALASRSELELAWIRVRQVPASPDQ